MLESTEINGDVKMYLCCHRIFYQMNGKYPPKAVIKLFQLNLLMSISSHFTPGIVSQNVKYMQEYIVHCRFTSRSVIHFPPKEM
jgi:hypothetical protein